MAGVKKYFRCAVLCAFLYSPSTSLPQDEDDDSQLDLVIVTGARITAGGAQDLKFARSEILGGRIPHPDTILAEGLLSEYDLAIPAVADCLQLFCLNADTIRAELGTLPAARYLVGLGFSSNIDPETWKREATNIVAVVDKSGSMSGEPLELVKVGLSGLINTMTPEDQLSVVLYGDRSHIHLPPTRVTAENRTELEAAIASIESAGSTNMEEGLQVGYQLAQDTQVRFEGITRVLLFTDERPNVGNTDAAGFIGMATQASSRGIGLTTIGVGVQFDTKLSTALSSTRGGNLFFLDSVASADSLFGEEFDYMVSEVAHDLHIALRPNSNYQIAGIYGVPGELLGWQDEGVVSLTIPTVFLSQRGGGIFVSLSAADRFQNLPAPIIAVGDSLMAATVSYLPVGATAPESGAIQVFAPLRTASPAMELSHALIDEYLGLRSAMTAHYMHNDQETAYQVLRNLSASLNDHSSRAVRRTLQAEQEIVDALLDRFALLSGRGSEVSRNSPFRMLGDWEVVAIEGSDDLVEVGDVVSFSPNSIAYFYFFDGESDEGVESEYVQYDSQEFLLEGNELRLPEEELIARIRLQGDMLTISIAEDDYWDAARLRLNRFEGEL